MNYLTLTYLDQEHWVDTEELAVQAMKMHRKVLGPEHPHTLTSMDSLTLTWRATGRHKEALKLMEKCVKLRKKILGVNHTYFLSSSAALNVWRSEDAGG